MNSPIRDCLAKVIIKIENSFSTVIPYMWGILAAVFITLTNLFVKKISKDFTITQILFFRSLGMALFTYWFMCTEKMQFHYKSTLINKLLFTRALFGTAGSGLIFYGVILLPLSDATVLMQTYPVYTGILATLLVGEKYERSQLIAALVCLVGVIMIAQPPALFGEREPIDGYESSSRLLGTVVVLLGGLCASGVEVLIKKVGGKTNVGIASFVFGVMGAITGALLSLRTGFGRIEWHHVPWLVLIGLSSFSSQVMRNRAFLLGNVGRVSNTAYFGVVFSFFVDIFILGNDMNVWSLLGGLCILMCMIIYLIQLYYNEKKARAGSI